MKKYLNKKVIGIVIAILLGLGIYFGEETRVNYLIDQAMSLISLDVDNNGVDETTE